MKICSASLIKITVRNHFISICLENIKKPQNMQLVRLRNNGNPCTLLVELQIGTFSLEHHAALSTQVEYVIHWDLAVFLLRLKSRKTYLHQKTWTRMLKKALFVIIKIEINCMFINRKTVTELQYIHRLQHYITITYICLQYIHRMQHYINVIYMFENIWSRFTCIHIGKLHKCQSEHNKQVAKEYTQHEST